MRPRARASVGRSFESAATLGVIVLVRIVLSFSLEIELDGRLPWRKGGDTPPSA